MTRKTFDTILSVSVVVFFVVVTYYFAVYAKPKFVLETTSTPTPFSLENNIKGTTTKKVCVDGVYHIAFFSSYTPTYSVWYSPEDLKPHNCEDELEN